MKSADFFRTYGGWVWGFRVQGFWRFRPNPKLSLGVRRFVFQGLGSKGELGLKVHFLVMTRVVIARKKGNGSGS